MPEGNDRLWLSIFEYGEVVAVEVGHDMLLVVDHCGVQQDFVDILADDKDSVFGGGCCWFEAAGGVAGAGGGDCG